MHSLSGPQMLSILPSGHVRVDPCPGEEYAPGVVPSFERGVGHGILHLALEHLDASLPPDLAWLRELARVFLSRVCATYDLEAQRERLRVPAPTPWRSS